VPLVAAVAAIVLLRDGEKPGPTVMSHQMYTGHGGASLALDVFVPSGEETGRPAVLVLHGGSWRGGSRRDVEKLAIAAAGQGFVVVNAEYGLDQPSPPSCWTCARPSAGSGSTRGTWMSTRSGWALWASPPAGIWPRWRE
jgi:poly(3-hydroxybutyrate) depolymerase